MALVDSLESDVYALRDAAETDRAALAVTAAHEADLRASSADAARRAEESSARELVLAAENVRLQAEAARLYATVDAMNRSLAWRLFTPWWKLKELLKR